MKRTKEKQDLELENEERQTMFKNEISEAMKRQGSRFIKETSYCPVETLVFGRMAFKGMNPEIEKMMENERLREEEEREEKREKEVQDQEMAVRYGSIKETIGRKFASKRSRKEMENPPVPGGELIRKGAEMVEKMRKNNKVWSRKQDGGGRKEEGKRRKFMKPKD